MNTPRKRDPGIDALLGISVLLHIRFPLQESSLSGVSARSAHLGYLPVVAASWVLGGVSGRCFTDPVDRALRARWLPGRRTET